ncbi:toll/interleukin-1 receptor domain-containing protein [Saccharothrix deserti]|uniref:toll/interleukin-1 receptor domain-containing protein n=1 Tax=Saccharothrix deserti TaxID=2593674 RepID=UPI00131AE352|nr:toll/interleukin-1 receptor domain-containing protein [Saccharothrix deserti]
MPHTADRPNVFLSFSGNDRDSARLLAKEFGARGFDAFVDELSIAPGADLLLAINRGIDESDYFVLLWSRHTLDRKWVAAEWTAALARDLDQRRCFLFVVRLDDTPLPTLLAPRKYLDADDDLVAVADALAAVWRRDSGVGTPVLPPPGQSAVSGPTITVYVRNRALAVAHAVKVPAATTGRSLKNLVRLALALPDQETKFDGAVGIRFGYELLRGEERIPDDMAAVAGLADGDTVDLEVRMESFGPDGTFAKSAFRQDSSGGLPPEMVQRLVRSAFDHLIPRQRRPR